MSVFKLYLENPFCIPVLIWPVAAFGRTSRDLPSPLRRLASLVSGESRQVTPSEDIVAAGLQPLSRTTQALVPPAVRPG